MSGLRRDEVSESDIRNPSKTIGKITEPTAKQLEFFGDYFQYFISFLLLLPSPPSPLPPSKIGSINPRPKFIIFMGHQTSHQR